MHTVNVFKLETAYTHSGLYLGIVQSFALKHLLYHPSYIHTNLRFKQDIGVHGLNRTAGMENRP